MNKLRYHFVGICGISMSALAIYLLNKGNYVQGSDISNNKIKADLKNYGIEVFDYHKKENINNIDVVVYNYAISKTNIELIEAKKQNIKIISRAELLAQISSNFKHVISVSGSHGKTSTTAMLYNCLKCAKKFPTVHIGGLINNNKFGFIEGKNDYFVTEACEYHDSFLKLNSTVSVILNIEAEHLDYFKTLDNEKKSYQQFANKSKFVISGFGCVNFKNGLTFGKNADITAKNIRHNKGKYTFDCYVKNKFYGTIKLGVYGKHNINNALAVIGVCIALKINKTCVMKGLGLGINVKRRFEVISNAPNLIVHDYAHHPTEIAKTINLFKQVAKNRIMVVFQPHTFSRTKSLFNNFVLCFKNLNNVLILKTYSAREKYDKYGSAYALYKELKLYNNNIKYCANFDYAKKIIQKNLQKNYDILILGAGDIDVLANNIKDWNFVL